MRYFLSRLKIEGFRGINNESDPLTLKFKHDKVNSIFAVNGFGKSSIFEALCYAIRGNIPKLTELTDNEKPEEYVCNKFHSKGLAQIEIELKPDDGTSTNVTILVQRDKKGKRTVSSPSGHPDPEGLLRILNKDFTLIDYRTFGRFIDDSPLERGRSFSSLLGLSEYSIFRQAFQTVCDARVVNTDFDISTLRADVSAKEAILQDAVGRIKASYNALIGKPITDMSQLPQYTNDVLGILMQIDTINEHVNGKTLEQINFEAIKDTIRLAEGGEKRRELEKIIGEITELETLRQVDESSIGNEQSEILLLLCQKKECLMVTRGDVFKNLYSAAKAITDSDDWADLQKCPLCESDLNTSIAEIVDSQLKQYQQVAEKNEEIKDYWQIASWVRHLKAMEQSKVISVADEEKLSASLIHDATNGQMTYDKVANAISKFSILKRKCDDALSADLTRKAELEKELPQSLVSLTENVEHARQYRDSVSRYCEIKPLKDAAQSKLTIRERWHEFNNKAAGFFSDIDSISLSRTMMPCRKVG